VLSLNQSTTPFIRGCASDALCNSNIAREAMTIKSDTLHCVYHTDCSFNRDRWCSSPAANHHERRNVLHVPAWTRLSR
jgi:hypothetical protein